MNEFYQTWLIYTLAFLVLAILPLMIVNFFTQGFFAKWLAVKISRGKKFLVVLDGIRRDRYFTGVEENEMIVFKDYKKETRRLALPKNAIRRGWGIDYVVISDDKNAVINIDFNSVPGFDAEKNNSLYLRALYKPTILDGKQQLMIILLVLSLLGLLYLAYDGYVLSGKIQVLTSLVESLKTPTAQATSQALTSGGA